MCGHKPLFLMTHDGSSYSQLLQWSLHTVHGMSKYTYALYVVDKDIVN